MVRVTLDAETFKALASATRLTVLRALDERRKTLTELARDLELNKATVHEHLQLLQAAGLVRKRDDEGRKWIYYELTWRGERILHPQETTTFSVLLGLGVAAAGGGFVLLGRALGWWLQEQQARSGLGAGDAEPGAPEAADAPSDEGGEGAGSGGEEGGSQSADAPSDGTALRAPAPDEPAPGDGDGGFLDDDGWLALALLAASLLFGVLAALLRRKLRSGPLAPNPPPDAGP